MKQFVETIRVEEGLFCHLEEHLLRLQNTSLHFHGARLGVERAQLVVPPELAHGVVKCRIVYSNRVEAVEFQPYDKRQIRRLQVVRDDAIDYAYKSTDRYPFQQLLVQKGDADEIIIVKNGFVTDTSYSNLVFENKEGLFTPDTFLLNGIQRQHLLREGVVRACPIREEDMARFSRIHLVNAMLRLGELVVPV